MACKTEQREFEDSQGTVSTFFVRQLPAAQALDLQVELLNTMGANVFPFIEGNYDYTNIVSLMGATEHKKFTDIVKRIVCMATKDGQEVTQPLFNHAYNGELMLICKVFAFVCEVNFKDFFIQGLAMSVSPPLAVANPLGQDEQK
ncbi:MAG: hypothetical protein EKE20_14725 [Candidatus Symbiopectobacterium sp. Dall1.0]|nr:hypothetical protein [Candidatus Symbiopectobacterium sp. Dall1.0]